jgi:uncharacterized protein
MTADEKEGDLTRRRFLGQVASLAALAATAHAGESLQTEKPVSDALGPTLARRPLGRTGQMVTMLGMGGAHLEMVDDRAAQAMIETAIEHGIRFFDNSQGYADGECEAKYGRFLTPRYREHIFLMTKTDAVDAASAHRELDGSLRRLRTDYLDLWQMHAIESPEDVDERQRGGVFQAMEEARQSGKVRHLGFTGHRTPAAHLRVLEVSDQFETCQMPVNAADPSYNSFIRQVMPVLVEKNLGVLAMKTLSDQGFFGINRWAHRPTGRSPLIPDRISLREAIHFVWSLPVSTLITGAESLEQLQEKIRLAQSFTAMSPEERQQIIPKVADLAGNAVEYYKA